MDRRLIFVPDNDHSAKNGNVDCAVFFNCGPNPAAVAHVAANLNRVVPLVSLGEDRRGVVVTFAPLLTPPANPADTAAAIAALSELQFKLQLLLSAVEKQTKVEIKVDIAGAGTVKLIDIVEFPAE